MPGKEEIEMKECLTKGQICHEKEIEAISYKKA